ncbi:Hypothetical_protein [Hexamita inflata]|uniref:Hypothetical_protein n=1 Tax=Hexamita inflata TaxID=28002 RepID=A0AA86QR23_9EUKA|nr:Hypothetical protein HINF_LOCUS52024 [Hexamita inflata]
MRGEKCYYKSLSHILIMNQRADKLQSISQIFEAANRSEKHIMFNKKLYQAVFMNSEQLQQHSIVEHFTSAFMNIVAGSSYLTSRARADQQCRFAIKCVQIRTKEYKQQFIILNQFTVQCKSGRFNCKQLDKQSIESNQLSKWQNKQQQYINCGRLLWSAVRLESMCKRSVHRVFNNICRVLIK